MIDELNMREWFFGYDESKHQLYPAEYQELLRWSKRHKWVVVASTTHYRSEARRIVRADIPLTPDVIAEARQQFIDTLSVGLRQ